MEFTGHSLKVSGIGTHDTFSERAGTHFTLAESYWDGTRGTLLRVGWNSLPNR
jgi:hypothetical protein